MNQETKNNLQDDLVTLSQIFSLSHLSYIDIDLQERLAKISARWPLLVELIHSRQTKGQHEEVVEKELG
jgi:hypothetical protein